MSVYKLYLNGLKMSFNAMLLSQSMMVTINESMHIFKVVRGCRGLGKVTTQKMDSLHGVELLPLFVTLHLRQTFVSKYSLVVTDYLQTGEVLKDIVRRVTFKRVILL